MIAAAQLAELLRRFVLLDNEPIVQRKDYPDLPEVFAFTAHRAFSVKVVRDWLLVERAPWVAAVVLATQEDLDTEGPPPRYTFLVQGDGTALPVDDPAVTARLGSRLHAGELDVMAYAELLVECQWPGGGWLKRVVTDPVPWRGEFPARAKLPPVEALRTTREDGGVLSIRFFASRENTVVVGGRPVLDVAVWSVRAPAGEPATWDVKPVAEAVPLLPPW